MSFLNDGYQTTIEFDVASGVTLTQYFKEKTVTPPGVDAGGENDTTTMRNTTWRTKQPKALKTLTNSSFVAAYDPAVLDVIVDELIGVNGLITINHPDGSTWAFYGWLNTFTPGTNEDGAQPTAVCEIIPSNQKDNGDEVAPDYAAAA